MDAGDKNDMDVKCLNEDILLIGMNRKTTYI